MHFGEFPAIFIKFKIVVSKLSLSCTTDHYHSPLKWAQKVDRHDVVFTSHDHN